VRKTPYFLAALVILYIFLHHAWFGLAAGFTHDDLMNMHRGLEHSYRQLLADCALFWRPTPVYRPLVIVTYKFYLDVAGLDLTALNIFRYLLLCLNLWLAYTLGRCLSGSREAGVLAALLMCYHPALSTLYCSSGTLFDILCFLFFYAAFLGYARIRASGRFPNLAEGAGIHLLFILALDSKEMAVTLPLLLALYELVYHGPALRRTAGDFFRAMVLPLITGAGAAAYAFGRVLYKEGIASSGDYRGVYTAGEYVRQAGHYFAELLNRPDTALAPAITVALLAAMPALAAVLRSRALLFSSLLWMVGILPVAFIPWRGLNAAYIPMAGIAVYCSVLLSTVRKALAESLDRRMPELSGVKFSAALLFIVAAAVLLVIPTSLIYSYESMQMHEYQPIGNFMRQLPLLHPHIDKPANVLVVEDPFGEFNWASLFIIHLVYREPGIVVHRLASMDPKPTHEEIARYNYRLAFDGKTLRDVPPEQAIRLR